ncbi:MAG TPA: hypothetical protein ENI23_17805 [bacterium]|nr:hypothetical protein [bacterium]
MEITMSQEQQDNVILKTGRDNELQRILKLIDGFDFIPFFRELAYSDKTEIMFIIANQKLTEKLKQEIVRGTK